MTLSPPRELDELDALAPATSRLQQKIDDVAARGGGRVMVRAGVHRTGALRLRSRVELHLEAGAVLRFVPDPALYPVVQRSEERRVGKEGRRMWVRNPSEKRTCRIDRREQGRESRWVRRRKEQ